MADWEDVSETGLTSEKRIQIVFDSVLYCARQGITMKGQIKKLLYQYDDAIVHEQDSRVAGLTNFLMRAVTQDYSNLDSQPKTSSNATSLSKKTQDQILETCRSMLTSKLVAEVKEAKFFSLITENTFKDDDGIRIPLFVRFVDKNLQIREELLQYFPRGTCTPDETLPETIVKNLVQVITELGLSMEFCRGVNFDSGNNLHDNVEVMRKIQEEYPNVTYVHARSDLLNDCITSSCDILFVFIMLRKIEFTEKLFKEEKVQELMKRMIKEVMPESEHSRLIELYESNWAETAQRFSNLVELYPAIIATYDEINAGQWREYINNGDKMCEASGVSDTMAEFDFIIGMLILANCLELTLDLTEELQKVCHDSTTIREKVSEVLTKLDELKSNIKEHHLTWYEKAVSLGSKINVEPKKESISCRIKIDPEESVSDHYLRGLTVPFVDHVKAQIQLRFSEAYYDSLDGLAIMPRNVLENKESWKAAALRFLKRYKDDQPEYFTYFDAELRSWEWSWKDSSQQPDTVLKLLSSSDLKVSYQLFAAFKIYLTLPLVPTGSEMPRVMPFINEELCLYSMTDKYLNALALLSIRGKGLETKDVIECYRKKYHLLLNLDDD